MIEVKVADNVGFCFGVDRIINMVREALNVYGR